MTIGGTLNLKVRADTYQDACDIAKRRARDDGYARVGPMGAPAEWAVELKVVRL
jgi:hypothetical protein